MAVGSSSIIAEYCRRTAGSARLAEHARGILPSGIAHDSRQINPYPVYIGRAERSRKWDVDGNEYVDYSGGHGALLFGHNHPVIRAAIESQLALGTHYGSCHELEIRWAELVRLLMPSCEVVRFTNSGTEATLLALRLARAFTGRSKILRFTGHFHGWHDHAAIGDGAHSPGVLSSLAGEMLTAPADEIGAIECALARGDVAGVIVEPTGSSWGQVPLPQGFLENLRTLTRDSGTVLIFDEVISGFRCSPGGAQAYFGIHPDLTTLAKILAGGLPGGAVGGRADIMQWLAFPAADSPRSEKIPHYGTFNANPLSAAAGIATLELIAATDACQRANEYAELLRGRMNEVLREEAVPWLVHGTFSGFHIFTNPQGYDLSIDDINAGRCPWKTLKAGTRPGLVNKLRLGLLLHGVDLIGWPGGPTSAVHSQEDLELTTAAFRESLRMLHNEGELS